MLKFAILLAAVAVCYGQSSAPSRSTYILYTKKNEESGQLMPGTGDLPTGNNFDDSHNTIILIHGHQGRAADPFNKLIREEILMYQPEHNVIEADWSTDAGLTYSTASSRVPLIATDLGIFTTWLAGLAPNSNVHLVGFGLGAHIAGNASRGLGENKVARITGLDPSGSGWGTNSLRLKNDDAQYVEVIHTDGSGLLANGIGTAIGQINFYVNGGSNQPGCLTHSCSHNRAYELFASSISSSNLVGYPCSSTTQLNLNLCRGDSVRLGGIDLHKRGVNLYRINTKRSWPF